MRTFLIVAAALSIAAPLHAEPVQTVTAVVGIADINLASRQGQHVLKQRIAAAVERVCGPYANASEQYEQMRINACRASAMAEANKQVASKFDILRLASSATR